MGRAVYCSLAPRLHQNLLVGGDCLLFELRRHIFSGHDIGELLFCALHFQVVPALGEVPSELTKVKADDCFLDAHLRRIS